MKPKCRICSGGMSDKVCHLHDMPLTDDFVEISNKGRMEYIHDIQIYRCEHCGVTQNPDDFNHEEYYQDYQYSTGHSEHTKRFMDAYAAAVFDVFKKHNGRAPRFVLEVGSGDGQQLISFKPLGVEVLLGVEPSEYLARIANKIGIETQIGLFGTHMPSGEISGSVDVCMSSYTFDHVRQPLDYLKAAYNLLVNDGVLALEIHDFGKIVERTEFCLFEHEHTIYLNEEGLRRLLERTGFSVLSVNPLPSDITRGNSLIVIAKKMRDSEPYFFEANQSREKYLDDLQKRITSTIEGIDDWVRELPECSSLVGFGAGGRGIMTVAALSEYKKIRALLDSNYKSKKYLAPKTRIPIVGPDSWGKYRESYCIVFSFGYYHEISNNLIEAGFEKEKIISLLDFYPAQ